MSYEAEQNVIGSLFLDMDYCMDKLQGRLEPQMFESELLGAIYYEFQKAYGSRTDINSIIVVQKLKNDRYTEALILEEIKECISVTVTSATVSTYADIVVKGYKARQLNQILSSTIISLTNIDDCIDDLLKNIEALRDNRERNSKALPVIVKENKDKYFKDKSVSGAKLGFPSIDDLIGDLEGGDVIVIGARPAVGKSAFATQIASNIASMGKKVGYFNLEMNEKQIYERFVVSESGIGLTRLRRALRFLEGEKEKFDRANERLEKKDNIVINSQCSSVSEIRAESRHAGFDVIIIDYLQLLKAEKTYKGNRYAEVGEISRATKALAKELKIPVIELSQINRLSTAREDAEPTMSELRESGDIEQDASVILLLWNSDKEDKSKKGCKVEKARQGRTGKIQMRFNGDMMRFEEVSNNNGWQSLPDDADIPFT